MFATDVEDEIVLEADGPIGVRKRFNQVTRTTNDVIRSQWSTCTMKIIDVRFMPIAVCCALSCGCSPSAIDEGIREDASKVLECYRSSYGVDLSIELEDLVKSFESREVSPGRRGDEILGKIGNLPDMSVRTNCLVQFKKAIFGVEFKGYDYIKLSNGLGSMECIHPSYIDVATRSGCGYDEEVDYRIGFLKWLQCEMARPHEVDTSENARRPGLHVSKEMYEKALRDTYKLHLRWMEEGFNRVSIHPAYTGRLDSVRCKLEEFLGRPIRTDEELLRDSGMKK